jgi:hypothetical protein
MRVRLHIRRLVVDGLAVTPADRPVLQAAVEAELVRLLGDGGLIGSVGTGRAVPSVDAGVVHLRAGVGPRELGEHIAGAVHGGLLR